MSIAKDKRLMTWCLSVSIAILGLTSVSCKPLDVKSKGPQRAKQTLGKTQNQNWDGEEDKIPAGWRLFEL